MAVIIWTAYALGYAATFPRALRYFLDDERVDECEHMEAALCFLLGLMFSLFWPLAALGWLGAFTVPKGKR
jgi:hypothetical protein